VVWVLVLATYHKLGHAYIIQVTEDDNGVDENEAGICDAYKADVVHVRLHVVVHGLVNQPRADNCQTQLQKIQDDLSASEPLLLAF
jgi:hypothetical protein